MSKWIFKYWSASNGTLEPNGKLAVWNEYIVFPDDDEYGTFRFVLRSKSEAVTLAAILTEYDVPSPRERRQRLEDEARRTLRESEDADSP